MGMTVQYQFSAMLLHDGTKSLGVCKPFSPVDNTGYRRVMNQNHTKQTLVAGFN
jgi:hypothetical protein